MVTDQGWSLPIYCDPYTNDARTVTHWCVRSAVELLADPFFELSKRFAPINLGSESTFWIITAEQLEKMAAKVAGCVPKDYLVWGQNTPGKETVGLDVKTVNDKDEDFVRYFCTRSSIDLPLGRYVWKAVTEGMRHWLINAQKPIEFEMFTIYPLPFRCNWKEIQVTKHPRCFSTFRKKRSKWHKELLETGFIEDMGSTDLMSMNKNKTFNWCLELVPSKLWMDSVKEAETMRLTSKGPVKYANYYESSIRKRFDDVLATFHAWLREITNPVGSICQSPFNGSNILVPSHKNRAVSASRYRPSVTAFQLNDGGVRLKEGQKGRSRPVSKTLKKMLDLSSVPSSVRDLREPKGPTFPNGGTSGLFLQNANEGPVEGQRLLAEGEGTNNS